MRTVLVILLLQARLFSFSQERCASTDYVEAQKTISLLESKKITEADNFLKSSSSLRTAGPVLIKIPVVVHVIYNKAEQNISDAQVKSQIDALNRDFRRKNSDTVNTPERFQSVAADVQIEFYLATADAKGRATNGIIRKYSGTVNWLSNDKIKFSAQGGDDAWDSKSYLNIWVGNFVAGAGYSSVPGGDETKDGVVINAGAFGTINVNGAYSMGRTATHEIGHWLGLRHIWGDAKCGDDLVEDTPPQSSYTQGCPTGFRSTCSNGEMGDMYMNYMDYTADACMNLFTEGQKRRMMASFAAGGPRASILKSKGLNEAWVEGSSFDDSNVSFSMYPNPAQNELNLKISSDYIGKFIYVLNLNGSILQTVQIKSGTQKLNLSTLKAGVYFIKLEGATQKLIKL